MILATETVTNGFTLFWQGPFSQWYHSKFIISNIVFCCAEQYMMYQKALMFGDQSSAKEILESNNPSVHKAIGRTVKNFDKDTWNSKAKDIVYDGNYAKFIQSEILLGKLLSTKGTELVEASPYDRIWGVGLRASNPNAWNKATWQGTNWLGEVLTQVRDDLIEELGDRTAALR